MSVITDADIHRDKAVASLKEAIDNFRLAIDSSTWGSEDWRADYRKKLREDIHTLEVVYDSLAF